MIYLYTHEFRGTILDGFAGDNPFLNSFGPLFLSVTFHFNVFFEKIVSE
jgi:hypothetical protein